MEYLWISSKFVQPTLNFFEKVFSIPLVYLMFVVLWLDNEAHMGREKRVATNFPPNIGECDGMSEEILSTMSLLSFTYWLEATFQDVA